ncbi:putative transmembrane anti-sigma factor [Novosphingobium nitrogenifigens DSM 19370]|uniref:Putative transmembrane anti-sigma factor n=1 Tax=Novosphingobium nitrogenifigens DSM 19370 TaxID=983920 RepID=F1ZCE3_9SPHN|nr:anti-sigma factor [Novosphingobium nitrogenifigens]EGD57775.1 putative transmembrane anti-sigma factor [Novosphingobium nitrogenifigens DSM 19370]
MTDTPIPCADKLLALHAFADSELDALTTVAIEEHLRTCAGCRAALEKIEATRALLSRTSLRHQAPGALRESILAEVAPRAGQNRKSRRAGVAPWLGGGVIGALAASLALLLAVPDMAEPGLSDAFVDGQIRSLQGAHLVDVETSDRHTVKPWFNGRITYAPPVVDLRDAGFPLVGGRLDVVERENVAVLVYRRRLHCINLFIRPMPRLASPFAGETHRAGYNLVRWSSGGLEFWAVSDLASSELQEFRRNFERESR